MAFSRGKKMVELCQLRNIVENIADNDNVIDQHLSQEELNNWQWIVSNEETSTVLLPVENVIFDIIDNHESPLDENNTAGFCLDVLTLADRRTTESQHVIENEKSKGNECNKENKQNYENEAPMRFQDTNESSYPSLSREFQETEEEPEEESIERSRENQTEENKQDGDNEALRHGQNSDESYHPPYSLSESEETEEESLKSKRRKRIPEPSSWRDEKNKRLREQGKSYSGWSRRKSEKAKRGTEREARKMGPPCDSETCKKSQVRHCNLLVEENRNMIFCKFWNEMSWDQRKVYVSSLVKRIPTKRTTKTALEGSRRKETLVYTLRDLDGKMLAVCKKMFLSTFGLKEWMVLNWVNCCHGMHKSAECINSQKKEYRKDLFAEAKTILDNFLDAIPKLPSHYCRQSTSKLYVEPIFGDNMTTVYNEYVNNCKKEDVNIKPLSRFTFDNVIRQKNISFQTPKKDQCDTCCSYSTNNTDKDTYEKHIQNKVAARNEKNQDKSKGERGECIVLTQDLQAVKVCPHLNASALYYKTKLCCHNFTIFNVNSHHTRCYWFDETEADLTANTFASCLIDYLLDNIIDGTKPVIIWSDGCGYQNRNSILSNALLSFSAYKNVTVFQKYLERGHTQMEVDSVHAHIETKLKNKPIYLPSDYCRVTSESRKKTPYEVKRISYDFVKDYSITSMTKFKSIRPGTKANDPSVNDIKVIKYTPDGKIQVKLSFASPFQDLPRRSKNITSNLHDFPQLHKAPLKIKHQKWEHLQQLKTVIPQDCHLFYDNLPHL